ncbi:Thioredoxin [hydrothermal vent metagenome]|uniref:Thioredoxin n=1 Tax=hydrothermal vent metagenome TaxID=652676 RepID=A0A1W1BRE7_9ZZZZ
MKKQIKILISIIGAFILAIGILFYTKVLEIKKTNYQINHYNFQLKALNGKTFNINAENRKFRISGMEGKTVFLKIFGWDCEYCKKEIPQLIKLKKSLSDTFDVIAIEAQNHSDKESKEFIKQYGINYNIVSGKEYKNFYTYLQKVYGWDGVIPLTIVLSKEGRVLAFEQGSKSYSLSELLKASLLKK